MNRWEEDGGNGGCGLCGRCTIQWNALHSGATPLEERLDYDCKGRCDPSTTNPLPYLKGEGFMRRAHGREHFARTISNVSLTATSGRARSPLKDEPVEGEKKGDREGGRGKKEGEGEWKRRRRKGRKEEESEWEEIAGLSSKKRDLWEYSREPFRVYFKLQRDCSWISPHTSRMKYFYSSSSFIFTRAYSSSIRRYRSLQYISTMCWIQQSAKFN